MKLKVVSLVVAALNYVCLAYRSRVFDPTLTVRQKLNFTEEFGISRVQKIPEGANPEQYTGMINQDHRYLG